MTDTKQIRFEVDQKVKWISGANSSRTYKRGWILAAVCPGQLPVDVVPSDFDRRDYNIMFDHFRSGIPRNETSYLVVVPNGNRKPGLYWPRTKWLELVAEDHDHYLAGRSCR